MSMLDSIKTTIIAAILKRVKLKLGYQLFSSRY